ncbi:kinase-like domain-containing protein [Aspergillus floccosus]
MEPRMHYDDAAWEKSEEIADAWVLQFLEPEVLRPVGDFVVRHHKPDSPEELKVLERGAFNIALRMTYKNSCAVIRFPQPGSTMFSEEKVRNEIAIMRYIHDQTSIPVPFVIHWGTRKESPLELGPFIIMEYVNNSTNMYDALNTPGCPRSDRGILDPNIDEHKLESLYGELAEVLLQLSRPSFPRIGALRQSDDFTWEVAYRPLSMPMSELVQLGSLPRSRLPSPDATYETASSYYEALAELHIAHLANQRNDAIDSADDCRRKFAARCLFRKLARSRKLTKRWASLDKGPFKLWCDDFRPGNVLLGDALKIVGVVDWEFTYGAPVEFPYAPPWWLLIEKPENWAGGLEDWSRVFECRLQTFLKAMVDREAHAIRQGRLEEHQRLSGPMRHSWESGDFWVSYAARNNFAFDVIYWQKIDQRFFGPSPTFEDAWKERVALLDAEEKDCMERLVSQKQEEMGSRVLMWEPDEYTRSLTLGNRHVEEEVTRDER